VVRLRLLPPLTFAALVVSGGCDLWPFGPSRSVAGNWHFTSGRRASYDMSLTQSGDSISGVACVYPLGGIRPFPVRETAVTGNYPRIRFTDPWLAGCDYDLEFEADHDEIAGDCGERSLVRFTRGGSGACDAAGGTPAAPQVRQVKTAGVSADSD
jgi:hypothetical protein